jgi:serine/threonine-protein kinase
MPVGDSETIQMVDATALAPGSDFGPRYRIEALLGQGGMGRVYKAYDKELDRVVAIKVVRQGVMGEADAIKRFKQELLLASKISHKNILRIHDMGEVAGVRFISMAYVEGHDLYGIIRDNPKLPLDRILKFATQLAEALAAAHSEGVVHRDLKPQNILVNKDDQIFVSDFGLAKSFEEGAVGMTRTGAFLGTPRYMSPEQVEGKPADQRSDLYSYGLILYEMLVGDVPFTGESTLKVMYQRIQEKPKNPKTLKPDIPAWVARIVMRCLEKEPAARYQSAYEILADLQGSRSASGSRTVQIQLPEFTERRWIWWVAGAVALLAILFAIPPVRHLVLRTEGKTGSSMSGIPPLSQGKFVAILPFKVLGDEQALGYVAEGLSEALNTKLFQMKDLRLASDTATAKVNLKDPLDKIARSLGVNLIVQGVIQGGTDKFAVIVNLIDIPGGGKKLWTQQFTGVEKDLLTMEDQISSQLISAMDIKPTTEELARSSTRPTENVDAYDLYLRGRQALKGPDTIKAAKAAMEYFQQAIDKDPEFALAYTGLADAALVNYVNTKDSFWAQKSLAAAQRAEQLKDSLPEVHFALGSVYEHTGQTSQAIAELKRGLQLAPNSDAGYVRLGNVYMDAGQKEEAIAAYKKGIDVNPYYWGLHIELGGAYYSLGQNEKALEEFKKVTELEPENATGWSNVGTTYQRMGMFKESIPQYQKSIELQPNWIGYANLGYVYTVLKECGQAIQALEKSVELAPNQEAAVGNLADAYRCAGQMDKANATYDKAIALAFHDLQVNPQSTSAMSDLAVYYSRRGDPAKGMQFIRQARSIDNKDLELLFTQATVESLANKPNDAIRTLREALSKGYPVYVIKDNPDFEKLGANPEFQSLLKQYSQPPH